MLHHQLPSSPMVQHHPPSLTRRQRHIGRRRRRTTSTISTRIATRLSSQKSVAPRRILSFHKTKHPKHDIDLHSSSKLFHSALQPTSTTSLERCRVLWDRPEELQGDEKSSGNVPVFLLLRRVSTGERGPTSWLKKPLSIYGAG